MKNGLGIPPRLIVFLHRAFREFFFLTKIFCATSFLTLKTSKMLCPQFTQMYSYWLNLLQEFWKWHKIILNSLNACLNSPLIRLIGTKYSRVDQVKFVDCLSRPYPFKFFKGCFPQISLGPLLNTFSYLKWRYDSSTQVCNIQSAIKNNHCQCFVLWNIVESSCEYLYFPPILARKIRHIVAKI